MFGFGLGELVILAVVLVLLFGSRRVPELARGIGDALKHIRGIFSEAGSKDRDKNES